MATPQKDELVVNMMDMQDEGMLLPIFMLSSFKLVDA